MNLVFLGPQGSGKGTQAQLLVETYHFNYFEAGKILRSIAQSDNPNATMIKTTIEKGGLVPDEFVRLIAWDFINKSDRSLGLLFDGYPRSLPQYEHLEEMLRRFNQKIDRVVLIKISEEESIRRLSARRMCPVCGRIYNLITNPPATPNLCECGGVLIHRVDDQPEAIKKRLDLYQIQTQPVLARATQDGVAIEIDGERTIEVIHQEIVAKLGLATL